MPETRQHNRHYRLVTRKHVEQGCIETARRVIVCCRGEFVIEPKLIEKAAQPRVVVRAKARMRTEGVGYLRERLAEMGGNHFLIRDVVGHFAQPVHIVGKGDEPRLDLVAGENAERVAYHGRARNFTERADMRQAGRTVACLENHFALTGAGDACDNFAGLFERPRARSIRSIVKGPRGGSIVWGRHIDTSRMCAPARSQRNRRPYYQIADSAITASARRRNGELSRGKMGQFASTIWPAIQPRRCDYKLLTR